MIERQSLRGQTLYADLLQEVMSDAAPAGVGQSFTRKVIKGRNYWYLSVAIGRRRIQTYLGPDSEHLRGKIAEQRALWLQARSSRQQRSLLVSHLTMAGANSVPSPLASILSLLADGGVFRAGGVEVGPIAFAAYANMLGVRWAYGSTQAQTLDTTDPVTVAVRAEGIRLEEVLARSGVGFTPIRALTPRPPKSGLLSDRGGVRVDVWTPAHARDTSGPVFVERFGLYADPLHFLDFLLEDTQECVLLAKSGIFVHVPNPGRFALYKLFVAEQYSTASVARAHKEMVQAAQLIEILSNDMPGALLSALDAAKTYHEEFFETMEAGLRRLPSDQQQALKAMM